MKTIPSAMNKRFSTPTMAPIGPADPEAPLSSAIETLLQRHSVGPRWVTEPGPSERELATAIACALRAPDHGLLRPWRAVQIDRPQRTVLGDLFVRIALDLGRNAEDAAAEVERAQRGPVLLAWIARIQPDIDDVPVHEQWMSAGGALTLFLTALHAMGYGAKTLSGRKCRHPLLQQVFCGPQEHLVAFVTVGTPVRASRPRGHDTIENFFGPWQPGTPPVVQAPS